MSARKAYLFASVSHRFLGFYIHFYDVEFIEKPKEDETQYVSTRKTKKR
jgi:hypothetical protein